MNRLNLIALAMLTVAGNVVATQPEASKVGKMQRAKYAAVAAKDAVVAGAQVAADKAAEYKKTAIGIVTTGAGALVAADRKFNKGRATNFAMHQAVRLFNAVMANKSTTAKYTALTALIAYAAKQFHARIAEGYVVRGTGADSVVGYYRPYISLHAKKIAALTAVLGHLFGDKVVAGVTSVGTKAFNKAKAVEYAKLFNYLKTLGASLAKTRAVKAVIAHPRIAGGVAGAAAVAATGAAVYKTGFFAKKPAVVTPDVAGESAN